MWSTDYHNILEEQYWLSRRAHITITESDNMAEFERDFFVRLLQKDIEKETKEYQKAAEKMKSKR